MNRFKKISDYYHNDDEYKIELSSTDMLAMIKAVGFKVIKDNKNALKLTSLYPLNIDKRYKTKKREKESFDNLYDIIERLHYEIFFHYQDYRGE